MSNAWLQYAATSNRFRPTYIQGFLDVSGNSILRAGSLSIKNGNVYLNQGDISMNGNIITTGSLDSGAVTVTGNARIKNSVQIDNDASIMSSLGVGKVANDSYPLDVSGVARFSSSINVGGAATLASIGNVIGTSRFTGNVGIGTSAPTSDYLLVVNGKTRTMDTARFDTSVTVGASIDPTTKATLYVKDSLATDASNSVVLDVPNTLYVSTDSANNAQVNSLEVDTQNRVIKPYRKYEGDLVTDPTDGWDLGAAGAYSFNRVYGRSLEVSSGIGIGKDSNPSYAVDVSGATRLSGGLAVTGGTSLSSITDVTGTSKFSGSVGVGKVATGTNAIDISGNARVSGNVIFDSSLVIGQTTPSTAALRVNVPYNSAIANSVEFEVPNVLYKSTSSANPTQTNFLEIDTKTRSIKPYAMEGNTVLNSASTGWNLGGPGANRFNTIYGRDLQISTNTIKIEDNSGNQISMGFDATTGAVNYTVTTISGEVFVIKGVQTQKISSGNGTIDPGLLEFTGLAFGDTFTTDTSYNLASTFTYNLETTTYTGNGTYFSTSVNPQSLASFVSGQNLSTLLINVPNGTSVVIKVGAVDGRTTHLEGIDTAGSLISLVNKIISVKKTGSTVKWTLWNSENYQNVSGNFLHYIELKNINMANGTYYIAKTAGTVVYNISDSQYLTSEDLNTVDGEFYLYVNRGPGKNWTKVPVSLPKTGTIQTQHLANSAITTVKLANNSVTGDKIADGSISGLKITDNSITSDKIADNNVSTAKIVDGAITSTKLVSGVINSDSLLVDGIITGAKLVAGTIGSTLLDASAVTTDKLATGSVTSAKLVDSVITTSKIVDGAISAAKMATDSIGTTSIIAGAVTSAKIAAGAVTGDKIVDGTITAVKLAAGVITGSLLDASSVTMDKIASGAISTDKLASLVVTSAKLAADAVTTSKLVDLAVTDAKLAASSVIESKIGTGAITNSKIAANAVTVDKIVDGSISSGKLVDSAVIASKINTSAVTTDKLATASVSTAKLADYAVTSIKIANSAVDANQINDLAISTAKLAAGAVTTEKIGSAQVVAASIATDAVITDKIMAGAITTAKIASGAITTSLLDISAVSTEKIAASAVVTASIADAAVTTAKLNASSVTTSIIADGSITAAKLAAGFTLPSGAGGGSTINSASDISVNSIQVNGKAKFEQLGIYQQITGTTTIINRTYYSFQRLEASRISRTGDTIVSPGIDRLYRYKYDSIQGKFALSNTYVHNFVNNDFIKMSDDGNVIVAAPTWRFTTSYGVNYGPMCFVIKPVNSVSKAVTFQMDSGEGTNNLGYVIRGVTVSGDGTKLFVIYSDTATFNGAGPSLWGVYVYSTTDFSLLVKIPMQSYWELYNNVDYIGYGDWPFMIESSTDGTRIILAGYGYSSSRGRVMVFKINYTQTTGTVAMDVTNNTNPSYGLTGYKPLKLSDLPTRFRLVVNSNSYYVGLRDPTPTNPGTPTLRSYSATSFSEEYGIASYPIAVFEADRPTDLYSATGTNTYRLRVSNYSLLNNTNRPSQYYYLNSNGTSDMFISTAYNTTFNYAWQFFKNTTTGEIVLWSPSPGGNGSYITYNPSQTGDTFRISTSGTPIKFTIEPFFDFSSVNTATAIGTFDGTTTTGVTSRFGFRCAISSDGTKIAFSSGGTTVASSNAVDLAVRFYSYVADNNWTSTQTLLGTSITSPTYTIKGFGMDIRFNSNYTVMVIGSDINNRDDTASKGALSVYNLVNGSWVYYRSVYGSASTNTDAEDCFGSCVSISDNGYYMSSDGRDTYGNLYIYKILVPDLTSNITSIGSVYTDKLVLTGSSVDLVSGSDSATGIAYDSRVVGNQLTRGNITLTYKDSANTIAPILILQSRLAGVGYDVTGGSVEFRSRVQDVVNGFGYGDERFCTDYRIIQRTQSLTSGTAWPSLVFEASNKQYIDSPYALNVWQPLTIRAQSKTAGEICVGYPITSPASTNITFSPTNIGTYDGGSFTINSLGAQLGITTDWRLLNATRARMLLIRNATTGNTNCLLQNDFEFEIQTGRSSTTTITTSNIIDNRRLHIATGGEIGIGTSAVSGTRLTVAGDLNVSGYVASTKAVPLSFILNTSVTGPGTTSDMCKSIQSRTYLSKDGNVLVAAGPIAKTVYVYRRTGGVWNTTATTITKTDTDFAKYMTVSSDGTVIASSNGTTIWMYRWSGSTWVLQTQTIVNATFGANFVKNMRLTLDGSKILVVSMITASNTGNISIFDSVTGSVLVNMGDTLTNGAGINMAWSWMDLHQGVYYYWLSFGYWNWMNYNIDISDDSNTVIISSSNGPTTAGSRLGKVLVYDIDYGTSTATVVGTFNGSIAGYDYYGKRISINQNGTVIAFSAGEIQTYNYTPCQSRVYIYNRTVGSTSWTLSKLYNDTDAGLGLNGFGHELRLNSAGTTICISSIPHTLSGSGTDSLSCGMNVNGTWGSLFNLTGTPSSAWGDSIGIDDAGNIAVTEINNTATPHGGRINLYSLNIPSNNVQSYGSVVMKTGMSLTTRMTIDGNGFIGMGTAPVSGTALTISGSVNASGTVTSASDDRLKENEVLVTNATDTLMKLRPEIYDKKPDFTSTDTSTWQKETGLIAQDLWYGAPELRHLVKLGTHTDTEVCDYEPIIYPPLVSGVDISGVEYVTVNAPFKTDASGNPIDVSGNLMLVDASGNPVDASGNPVPPNTEVVMVDNRPKSKCVMKTVNTPVNPENIVDIPVTPDIQQDPDYTALGWGDTPASVNYIGLIPYLIKSIQELKAESDAQKERIRILENR